MKINRKYRTMVNEGYRAYNMSLPLCCNPYDFDDSHDEFMAWAYGWQMAEADAINANFELVYSGETELPE